MQTKGEISQCSMLFRSYAQMAYTYTAEVPLGSSKVSNFFVDHDVHPKMLKSSTDYSVAEVLHQYSHTKLHVAHIFS